MSTKSEKSFKELTQELEQIIAWFESGDVDLDQAVEKFEQGMKISKEIKKRLEVTEQKIKKLR